MSPSSELRQRVLAAAAALPSRTRPERRRRSVVLVVLSFVVAAILLQATGGLHHAAGRPSAITIRLVGGWTLCTVLLTWILLGRRGSTLARARPLLLVATAAAPLALLGWMYVWSDSYPEPFARAGYRCLALTVALAAMPLAAFFDLQRRVEPRHPTVLGALAGATAGAWAAIGVHLWCPLANPAHAFVGHVVPLVLLLTVGALGGRALLGVRRL